MADTVRKDTRDAQPDSNEQAPLDVAEARAAVYELLAATFDGDVETLADALEDGAFVRLAETLSVETDLEALDRDLDREALKVGYDNLFAVPGPHYVPPFASAHADDPSESFESDSPYHDAGNAGELHGDPAAAAARLYAAAEFDPERGDGIPDHVAASFEFMRALCAREAALLARESGGDDEAIATVRELQRETLARLDWLSDFAASVDRQDSAEGVFAALARFAHAFVAWDSTAVEEASL